jgi:aerobic-type carbon monoxide dehydrogenase small subunit (CoxS/CutS family)
MIRNASVVGGAVADTVRFRLNGKPVTARSDGDRVLLWALRTDFGLTGAKYGCGIGECGACTVLVDGQAALGCQTPVSQLEGREVVTIEGLAPAGRLHPMQEAFAAHGALQCGYCTPGMILSACALLSRDPKPSRDAIVKAMDGNLCRCGAHRRILAAIEDAAGRGTSAS